MRVPSVRQFREVVDSIGNETVKTTIKSIYLLCVRPEEICCHVTPYEVAHKDAKPYGSFMETMRLQDFKYRNSEGEKVEKVLVTRIPVAKRRVKTKKKTEWQDRLVFKEVAGPINPDFEPWTMDLLKRLR
ncbi:hypothetical protein MUP77_10695, partial [Candidatus Bathyarchaeota archaeon]|nr:hypothetical protein [Candidatus Bathyarchaeota archaeon]